MYSILVLFVLVNILLNITSGESIDKREEDNKKPHIGCVDVKTGPNPRSKQGYTDSSNDNTVSKCPLGFQKRTFGF